MKRLAIIATALLLSVGGAAAQPFNSFDDGNRLLTTCTSENSEMRIVCMSYIAGIGRAVSVLRYGENGRGCVEGITYGQERDVVVRYLQNHPEVRHLRAGFLAVSAIEEAWCPEPLPKTDTPLVNK